MEQFERSKNRTELLKGASFQPVEDMPFGEILKDRILHFFIKETLEKVLLHLGLSSKVAKPLLKEVLEVARKAADMQSYEHRAHEKLISLDISQRISEKLDGRAATIVEQITPFVRGGSILDLGCGDGQVGAAFAERNFRVMLADIYKHDKVKETGLEFDLIREKKPLMVETNAFDNTLLLTVLHHSSDPLLTLSEAVRVTKPNGNIIVIESVYGVSSNDGALPDRTRRYLQLDSERQRLANVFFDHFYNRIIHYSEDPSKKVNVPFKFNTPEGWRKIFEAFGLIQEALIHLGIDQETVPEYHTLHVLKAA